MTPLQERVWGYLFGVAIGDAIGLGTELMSKAEVRFRYPQGLKRYEQIVRDAHRVQWPVASWTNDTEMVLVMVRAILATKRMESSDVARAYSNWYYPEMHDITSFLRMVLSHPLYDTNPEECARLAWEKMGADYASSEGLARSSLVGLWNEKVEEKAAANTKITHHDSRCVAVATIIAKCANTMAYQNRVPEPAEVEAWANELNKDFVPYVKLAAENRLQELCLDDEDKFWYAHKSAAAALWAMWHAEDPESGINAIIMEAGDADTNGALAGGLLGIKFGYSAMPEHLINELRHPERIKSAAAPLAQLIENLFGA